MNGARWIFPGLILLGCASPADPYCREQMRTLQEEVRTLQRRVKALESKPSDVDMTLLTRFPPPEWSQERLSAILRREIVEGKFRNAEEAEFIENFDAWKRALERSRESGGRETPK